MRQLRGRALRRICVTAGRVTCNTVAARIPGIERSDTLVEFELDPDPMLHALLSSHRHGAMSAGVPGSIA